MKRKILIIGNTRGEYGVPRDVRAFRNFFCDNVGGAWETNEIDEMWNPTRVDLLDKIECLREEKLDYFIFVFTGHGGFSRVHNSTLIELSVRDGVEENVYESELSNIARHQLNILDCCRDYYLELPEKSATVLCNHATMLNESERSYRERAKQIYNGLVERSCPCQISLYACSKGQEAHGYPETGAVYSRELLDVRSYLSRYTKYITVEEAHSYAKSKVLMNPDEEQVPSARLPKCLASQRLPWALHAYMFD